MSDESRAARRYFAMTLVRIAGAAGAVFGLILIGRAHETLPKAIGMLIVLSAVLMIAIVPRALAHRWRSPVE